MELIEEFGDSIKIALIKNKMSQRQLAEKLEMRESSLSKLMSGRYGGTTKSTLEKMCGILNMKLENLIKDV